MAEDINNPLSIQQVTGLPPGASRRRRLQDILAEEDFGRGPSGPSIEDDQAAYDRFLQSGEAARRREEANATEQVLNNAQSRGLARSGIALKDIITQVLGPSQERASAMAAQFGLEQARNRSGLLENERNRAAQERSQRLGGRLSSILSSDEADISQDSQVLSGLQGFQQAKIGGAFGQKSAAEQRAFDANQNSQQRKTDRQNAVVGAVGGLLGSVVGAFCFHPATLVEMADGSQVPISKIRLGDETKGGRVLAIKNAFSMDMTEYDGVKVTAQHAVKEDGKWLRVKDSIISTFIPGLWEVFNLVTVNHRIYVPGLSGLIEFADDSEVDGGEHMTNDEALKVLNGHALAGVR